MLTGKLTPGRFAKVRKIDGVHGDGGNLWLQVTSGGAGQSWVFRWTDRTTKRDRNMGLGSVADIDIEEARELARANRRLLKDGKDPIAVRDAAKVEADHKLGLAKTVEDVIEEYFRAKIVRKGEHYIKQSIRLLQGVINKIGDMAIQQVDTNTILDKVGLRQMWTETNPTAVILHMHLKRTFDLAIAEKYFVGPNPAEWVNHLEHILPAAKDVHRVKHHPSLSYQDVARFLADVRKYEDRSVRSTGHPTRALWVEFVVLTGVRVSEARLATWDEFEGLDGPSPIWIVPPDHHKIGTITDKPHVMPVTKPMLAVLREMEKRQRGREAGQLVFPSPYESKDPRSKRRREVRPFDVGSANTFIKSALRWEVDITTHGFRTTLTDWATANGWGHLVDLQVGHLPQGKVAQAYRNDPLVEARRPMMEAWGMHCALPPSGAAVVSISKRRNNT
jgi:integrase